MEHITESLKQSLKTSESLEISPREKLEQVTFSRGMAVLSFHFPNQTLSREKTLAWYESLRDLTPAQFRKGIKKFCMMHTEIYPNTNVPAYIRQYGCFDETAFLTSGEAWRIVLDAVSRYGNYQSPKFDDETVAEAVRCVGWKDINYSENIDAVRGHFFKVYDQLVARKKQISMAGENFSNA